jgi:glycosyltransferase involved in cell wall biosynthesis
MILLDAIYINNGGGKILLDYLIKELEKSGKEIFYLLDKRVENNVPYLCDTKNNVLFLEASLINRHKFYKQNKNRFSSVLCFGDLPPSLKLNAKVFTYFHQQLYIKVPKDTPLLHKILFFMKRSVLKFIFKNSDFWILQTDVIKNNFKNKYKVEENKLLILPYYPSIEKAEGIKRESNTCIYISNAPPHKNHLRLINGFCKFYDQHKKGKLVLTVDDNFTNLLNIIKEKQQQNYPILNIGFIEKNKLSEVYQSAEYVIYPSLAESFGLGLVEAIDNGCKIIGAKLPYMFAVCEPSITFDPLDENSISKALSLSLQKNIRPSVGKVENKISDLISIL